MKIDLRLAVPAVAMWIGSAIMIGLPGAALGVASATWLSMVVAVALSLAVRRTRRWAGALIPAFAALAVVSTVIAAEAPARNPDVLAESVNARRSLEIELIVASTPRAVESGSVASQGVVAFRATLVAVRTPVSGKASDPADAGGAIRTSVRARIFAPGTVSGRSDLQIGERATLTGTVRQAERGRAEAFLVTATEPPTRTADAPSWLAWANQTRSDFAAASSRLPGEGGALLPGLAIGETTALSADLDNAMQDSSLSHLTAVSGSNCAVVVGLVLASAAAIGLGRIARSVCALIALAGFVILVTPDASVVRAAVMGSIVIISALTGRRGSGVPVLAAAVICLVVHDPWIARDYGFVLSVLATAGLIVLAPALAAQLSRWMPAPLAAMIAIPLAAQIACQPILVLLNPSLPVYGVGANLLAGPAAPAATVFGLIACALLPILPGVGFAFAQAAWVPSAWIAGVARTITVLPGNSLPWPSGFVGVTLVVVVSTSSLAVLFARGRRGRLLRPAAAATTMLVVLGYVGTLIGNYAAERLLRPGDWIIAACDVGQGDAFVVRSSGKYALVDTGPNPGVLEDCFRTLRIERVDLLVLTHYDLDHVGGASAVVGRVDVALVGPPEGALDRRIADELAHGGASVRLVASGEEGMLGGLRWRVMWPRGDSILMQTGNDGSVTVAFYGEGITALFLGDLGRDSQNAMMAHNQLGEFDVVKVAHHGSADQSETLYRRIRARLGLLSAGAGNRYGHPRDSIMKTLRDTGTATVRTDLQGMILVSVDPDRPGDLSVWTERATSLDGGGG